MQAPVFPTKLSPPAVPPAYVPRPRLDDLWDQWAHKKLILVTAGAGFGKTSFLAANSRAPGRACIWYSLDETDANPLAFASHLASAIVPAKSLANLEESAATPALSGEFLATIVAYLQQRPSPTFVILDDAHLVGSSAEILRSLERFLRVLPKGAALVLASREPLGIPVARLRSQGIVADLTARDLELSETELEALFKRRYPDAVLEARLGRRILDLTEGWAAGIEIFFQMLDTGSTQDMEDVLDRLESAGTGWFEYFAEEVIQRLDPMVRDFTYRSSILRRLEPSICDRVLQIEGSRSTLEELCRRNLFTYQAAEDGRSFRYHHLFHRFLRDQLDRTRSHQEVAELQRRAAEVFCDTGEFADAVAAYAASGDHEATLRLVETHGDNLLATGQYDAVECALSSIPRERINPHFVPLTVLGRIREVQGRWDEAESLFQEALAVCDDPTRRADLLSLLAQLGMRRGQYEECLTYCAKALADPVWEDARIEGRIYCLAGTSHCALGAYEAGERDLNDAREAFRKSRDLVGEGRALYLLAANPYYMRGQFREGKDAARQALYLFRKVGDPRWVCLALGVSGFVSAASGDERTARELSERALRLAEELDYSVIEGYCHYTLGRCALLSADLEAARTHFECSRRSGEAVGEIALHTLARNALAEVELATANRHAAAAFSAEALRIARRMKDPLQEAESWILLGLAVRNERPVRASRWWRRAERLLRRVGGSFQLHRLLLIRLDAEELDAETEARLLDELLRGVAAQAHEFLFQILDPERAARVLPQCLRHGIEPEYATRQLIQLGELAVPHVIPLAEEESETVRVAAIGVLSLLGGKEARQALARHSSVATLAGRVAKEAVVELDRVTGQPLHIQALGPLIVNIGEHRLTLDHWRSKRALRLFQLLLVERFKWIPKDLILERLWPDTDLDKAKNNLRQTIHVLRKTLEPGLEKTSDSHYIRFHNEACKLEPGIDHRYDVETFEASLRAADVLWRQRKKRQAEPHLRSAVELYGGSFLSECPYEEFSSGEREQLQDRYLRGLGRLVRLCEKEQRWADVIPLCRSAIAEDPLNEDVFQHLANAQLQLGHRRECLTTCLQYEKMMVREMDCPPSPKMKALAESAAALGKA